MPFRIRGLPPEPFAVLFGLPESELRRRGVTRCIADRPDAFPDRIELRDAAVGEALLLVNFEHQPADNPYRARHAIFVREGATTTYDQVDAIPDVLRVRTLSIRAFDADDLMTDADLCEGVAAAALIEKLFQDARVQYLHAHFARRGCFAARIERA